MNRRIGVTVGCTITALLMCAPSGARHTTKTYVGTVREVSEGHLSLALSEQSGLDIGFKCVPEACAQLKRVQPGHRVEAVFDDRDKVTNTLVAIRQCNPADAACDQIADRERRRLQEELARYEALSAAERREREELAANFKQNEQRLAGLPECDPSRHVIDIDVPGLDGGLHMRGGTVVFEFELGTDGRAHNVTVVSDDSGMSSMTKAMYDSLSRATFDPPATNCRKKFGVTTRLED